jgi:hypothetical protein
MCASIIEGEKKKLKTCITDDDDVQNLICLKVMLFDVWIIVNQIFMLIFLIS